MSYGHCIVLTNQNRDTVQIISVQDKAEVKEYKVRESTRHNKISDGYHGYMYNNTIGSVVMLVMCMIWNSTVYTIEIKINRAIDKSKPVKEACVNIPTVPLEFWLDPSI